MKAAKSKGNPKPWFRIENAHVDEDNATDEVTVIYIYDVIGDSWWEDATPASEFVKQLSNIKTPRIELHLNSPGGDIFDGVAIYNALKAHSATVTVIVDALAASAASFIAQAGDEVIMTKAATMMIHDGSAMAWGPASVMRDTADLLDKLSNTVAEIYSDRAGQTVEFWRNLMIEETWYNSHEAVEAGLADQIGEETKDEDDRAAQNKWDLSVFNYAGRNNAPDPLQVRQRIANRLKEMTVGKPQNTQGAPEGTPAENDKNPASPDVNPDAATTEGQAEEVQESREEETNTGGAPVSQPEGGTPPENKNVPEVTNQAGTIQFVVDGKIEEISTSEAANRLTSLTNFYNTARTEARKNFVTQLAADNKIMAPQIDKLTAYALSLSDEGFDAWKDTWDGASGHTMLNGSQPGGSSNHNGPQSQSVEDADNQLEIARDTVRHMKNGGVSEDRIKETPSYKALVAADPNFKL